jgi:hypothetical protein
VPVNRRSGVLSPYGRLVNSGVCSPGCASYARGLSCRSHATIASARSMPSLDFAPNGHSDRIAFDIIVDGTALVDERTQLSVRDHSSMESRFGKLSCGDNNLIQLLVFEDAAERSEFPATRFGCIYAGCRGWLIASVRADSSLCLLWLSARPNTSRDC